MTTPDPSLTSQIVETLESHGLPRDEYRLADEIDPGALERVVDSVEGPIEIRVAIRDVPLVVTTDGPRVEAA